jgi:hypothetical protein
MMKSLIATIGIPNGVAPKEGLHSAKCVKIATAFATLSGWAEIQEDVLAGEKTVDIIVGLNGNITQPELLEEWLRLAEENPGKFNVSVAPRKPVFHPKVLIARQGRDRGFAIVGSGNLTSGGQSKNIECGAYVENKTMLSELDNWFTGLSRVALNRRIINRYRKLYKSPKEPTSIDIQLSKELDEEIDKGLLNPGRAANDWNRDGFIADFQSFIKTEEGKKALEARIAGAEKIKRALSMPDFDFTKAGWEEFYGIEPFGWIVPINTQMSKQYKKLRLAFQTLASNPDEEAIKSVLSGGNHWVKGLGYNVLTKMLTVYGNGRREWPVLNRRVRETMLGYGYTISKKPPASVYLKFSDDMRQALSDSREPDFWAFDAFCEWKSHKPSALIPEAVL